MKRGKSKTSLKNSKNTKIVLGIFALVLISAVFVGATVVLDGKGFIVPKYSSEDVSAYSDCVKVTNNLAWDLFIPLNTSAEWNSFRNAILPLGLTKGACDSSEVSGCTDPEATNYNPLATKDDGFCEYQCVDNGGCGGSSCEYVREGLQCVYLCTLNTCTNHKCDDPVITREILNRNACASNYCTTNQDCGSPVCNIFGCREVCYPQVCDFWGECINGPSQTNYIC